MCDTTPSGEPGGSGRGECLRGAFNNRAPHRSVLQTWIARAGATAPIAKRHIYITPVCITCVYDEEGKLDLGLYIDIDRSIDIDRYIDILIYRYRVHTWIAGAGATAPIAKSSS